MFDALTRRSPRRRWSTVVLISSFGLHAAAALTVMVWSMWKIDKLVPERMTVSLVWGGTPTVELPPQESKKPEPQKTHTEHRRHIADAQPTKTPPPEVPPETPGGGETGDKATVGEVSEGPSIPCDGPCTGEVARPAAVPVCGDTEIAGDERCDDGNTVDGDGCSSRCQIEKPRRKEVSVQTIESLRVSGEAQILPPSSVSSQMQREGKSSVVGLFRVCLDAAGQVAEVSLRKSTGYGDYDARLAAGVRSWRYRPYSVDGLAVAACGTVKFVYMQR